MAIKPTITQYTAKYDNLLFFTREIIHVQANKPEIKAATNPNPIAKLFSDENVKSPLNISLAIFPKIKGITIRKEKRAALVLSLPNNTEVEIVAPLLEIPGNIAIA